MVKVKEVEFSYPQGDRILRDISFCVPKGEVVAITGPSGSGKSTLFRLINGLIPHYFEGDIKGEIILDSLLSSSLKLWDISSRIGSVLQDPKSQFFSSVIVDEMALGAENIGLKRDEIGSRIDEISRFLGLESYLEREIHTLSSGERQKSALGVALMMGPKVLLFDEPTSNLDMKGIDDLKSIISKYKSMGYTIIVIDHRLFYLRDLADRYLYINSGTSNEFSKEAFLKISPKLREEMGLRSSSEPKLTSRSTISDRSGEIISINNLSFSRGKLDVFSNFTLRLYSHDITCLIGDNGVGKTTLGRVLCGLLKESSGEVLFQGKRVPYRKRKSLFWFVMQDTDSQLFSNSVKHEVTLGQSKRSIDNERVREVLENLGLWKLRDKHPASLSGGEKQRLTIAIGVLMDTSILILDEPTSGLDFINMKRVATTLMKERGRGRSILVISHDYEFLSMVSNRVVNLGDNNG